MNGHTKLDELVSMAATKGVTLEKLQEWGKLGRAGMKKINNDPLWEGFFGDPSVRRCLREALEEKGEEEFNPAAGLSTLFPPP